MGGKTSNESKAKYNAKAYDRIEIVVKKGEKAKIRAYAKHLGLSLNAFISKAIEFSMVDWEWPESEPIPHDNQKKTPEQ